MDNTDMTITQKIREAAFDSPRENMTIDNKILVLEESIIMNNDINESDNQANIRIEIYNIDNVVEYDVLYYDFYNKFSNHITAHLLRTLPFDDKPVKYTTYIDSSSERDMEKTRRILSGMEIFFNDTEGLTISSLQHELRRVLSSAGFTTNDYIYKEEGLRLTVIQERLSKPKTKCDKMINVEKTFKEDKCVICLTNPPNILFCNCGHLCLCKKCNKIKNLKKCNEIKILKKCLVCKTENTILRIIE